ncbi:MAG: hypothetical protein CYPHOPRED_000972 [Cyphobasidiales sp. Tagirdzhanova-0007]|nr:MAG: hypothetical protein CYPHOPRED_000972 [Cyphobasidiales sp. Tagirdzhanova-0007]
MMLTRCPTLAYSLMKVVKAELTRENRKESDLAISALHLFSLVNRPTLHPADIEEVLLMLLTSGYPHCSGEVTYVMSHLFEKHATLILHTNVQTAFLLIEYLRSNITCWILEWNEVCVPPVAIALQALSAFLQHADSDTGRVHSGLSLLAIVHEAVQDEDRHFTVQGLQLLQLAQKAQKALKDLKTTGICS